MYTGPLESVIFQKRFPDQKIKSKVKKKKKEKEKKKKKKKKKTFTLCNKSPITTGKNIGSFPCCIMENMYTLIHFSPYLHTHAD